MADIKQGELDLKKNTDDLILKISKKSSSILKEFVDMISYYDDFNNNLVMLNDYAAIEAIIDKNYLINNGLKIDADCNMVTKFGIDNAPSLVIVDYLNLKLSIVEQNHYKKIKLKILMIINQIIIEEKNEILNKQYKPSIEEWNINKKNVDQHIFEVTPSQILFNYQKSPEQDLLKIPMINIMQNINIKQNDICRDQYYLAPDFLITYLNSQDTETSNKYLKILNENRDDFIAKNSMKPNFKLPIRRPLYFYNPKIIVFEKTTQINTKENMIALNYYRLRDHVFLNLKKEHAASFMHYTTSSFSINNYLFLFDIFKGDTYFSFVRTTNRKIPAYVVRDYIEKMREFMNDNKIPLKIQELHDIVSRDDDADFKEYNDETPKEAAQKSDKDYWFNLIRFTEPSIYSNKMIQECLTGDTILIPNFVSTAYQVFAAQEQFTSNHSPDVIFHFTISNNSRNNFTVLCKCSGFTDEKEVVLKNGLEFEILHKEYVNCKMYERTIQKLIICLVIKGDELAKTKFYENGIYYDNEGVVGNIKPTAPSVLGGGEYYKFMQQKPTSNSKQYIYFSEDFGKCFNLSIEEDSLEYLYPFILESYLKGNTKDTYILDKSFYELISEMESKGLIKKESSSHDIVIPDNYKQMMQNNIKGKLQEVSVMVGGAILANIETCWVMYILITLMIVIIIVLINKIFNNYNRPYNRSYKKHFNHIYPCGINSV